MKARLLLVALLLALPLGAQEPATIKVQALPTSLAGEWLFRLGHDPAWASPFRERRNWQTIAVPGSWDRQGHGGYEGHAWYLLRLFVPSDLSGEDLAVDLGFIGDADEVFINGRRIGGTGKFPPRFEMGTLGRRLYRLPQESLRFGEYNELAIHVFKGARFGGLLGPPPRLDAYARLLGQEVLRSAGLYALAAFLASLAMMQLILAGWRSENLEHLLFAGFLLLAVVHYLSHATWGPAFVLGHGATFRLHVAALLGGLVLFIGAIYRFLDEAVPVALLALSTVLVLGVAFALAWREMGDLYLWVYAAEVGMLAVGAVVIRRTALAIRAGRRLGAFLATLSLFGALVLLDILRDLGLVSRVPGPLGDHLSILGLLPFATVFSLLLFNRWASRRWGEPFDRAAGLVPRERFVRRLAVEIERARLADVPLSVALMRVPPTDGQPDQALTPAAGVLRRLLRQIDVLGRYQRDTFAILLADTEDRAAMVNLERLRRAVAETSPRGQPRIAVAAGLAQFRPTRHANAQELLQETEAALYAAIAEGGDCTATAP